MIRRPPRSTQRRSSAASDVYKRQVLPPAERALSFAEVETGYSREDLRRETARCLECGCSALFTCDLRRHATEYGADVQTFMGCLLYTSDAADDLLCVDLGGR